MAPTDRDTAANSGLSIRGAAAAAASTSTSSGTAATSGGDGGAAKLTAAKGAGGREKIKLSLKPTALKSPAKPSPKAVFDSAPLAANKDVKRASSALAEAVNDSDDSSRSTKPALARNSSSGSRFDVKGKARASEEPPVAPTEDPSTLAALEALKQGQLPATELDMSPRSPSPRAAADERHSEKRPRSPRPRSPRPRSPAGRRHLDGAFDTAGGLPYDGEPELPASGRTGGKSSRWDRPSSPPPRQRGDFDRPSARYQQDEDERKQHAIQTEADRYRNVRSDNRRAVDTTPFAYRSGAYDYDGRYGDHRNRSGYSTQYQRPPSGSYGEFEKLDYGGEPSRGTHRHDHGRSHPRSYDDRYRHDRDPLRYSDRDERTHDDRRDAREDHYRYPREDDDAERPTKRPRRDSASSSSKRDAAPIQAKKRDRSMSVSTDVGSEEEGEIDEHEKSILDDSSHQRVNDRLTQKTGHHESERSHSPYGARDGDRQRDRDRDRDREYNRRPSAPPPHLPSRPNPPNPSLPVPPRLAPPYNTPTARDANALPPRPLNAPSLPAKPHVVGVQPMAASSSSGRQADRPPTHGAALPLRPPPPPEAPLERPQAPYHPAVPISANVADVTPVESAAPSRALTPAVPAMTAAVEHAPPAVRTQRPHEELWLRTLQPDEEIEGVFSAATTPAPPLDRKYVGCSHISEYTLQEKLGEGTFGVVWKGRRGGVDPATNMSADEEAQLVQRGLRVKRGDVVALKQIIFHNEGDGLPITSVREIRILKMLDHPNVVPVVDIAYEPADHANFKLGKTFMVFPYMDHDLAGLLENRIVRLETAHIKQYSKQLLEGTAYLHRNLILHRDMKAANLLINNQGQLMIADFGLARSIHKAEENAAYTSCVVTRWYRPPELLLGEKRYHTPVDMWGVACVMAEMYQRSPIFPGQSDFDQAVKIFAACGPPTSDSMPGWEKLPGVEGHEKYMWPNNGRSIRAEWSTRVDELFGDLIDRILVLDPKKRLTAEEALDHDWFWTEPYPTDPARMPQYKASHEMDGRKRKEEQHAAFGAVPMPPFPQQQQQPNGMRSNVPIPNYGAPPIAAYNGGQVAAPPLPPPVGVFNGPPPATMAAHGYPGPQQQQQPPPPQMGGYGAAGLGPGPSGMAAGMGMGGGGYRPPPHGGGGGPNHNHNHSYAAPGPPIATAGGGMQPRRMGLGAGQYEGMRQGPSWNPHANVPARPGPPAKVNLMDKFKKQR